jgi:hypothetical protein
MRKPAVVAMIALAVASTSIAYAQQHYGGQGDDAGPRFEHRHSDSSSSSSEYIKVADDYCNTQCDQQFNYCQYRGGSLDDCVERLRVCRAVC